MPLQQQDLETITDHIQKAFPALLEGSASVTMHPSQSAYWLERIAKIEEELRHQREILEMMMQQMEKRFEQIDKRFEEMRQDMNRRFEQMDRHFEMMMQQMDKRFEQVDKRFDEMRQDMNQRFEQMEKRFAVIQWMIGIGFTVMVVVMPAVFKYI